MTYNSSANFKLMRFLFWTKGSHQSPNFDNFKCPGENLPNFSCHFSNQKSVFLQILHHSSMPWKITPLNFFSSNNIYLLTQKGPIKVTLFETSECSGQNFSNSLCQFWNNKLIPYKTLYHSSVSWKITLAQKIYTLFKSSASKWKFLRLSSAQIKVNQIAYVNFETTSQILFKFSIILHCHDT